MYKAENQEFPGNKAAPERKWGQRGLKWVVGNKHGLTFGALLLIRRDITSRENRGNRETASGRKWKSRLRWVGLGAAAAGGTGGGAELPAR